MYQDPHAVLGVPRGVSLAALKRAFRSRARATHPDHGGDRVAFEAVVAAFEALRPDAVDVAEPIVTGFPRPRWPYGERRPASPRFCAYDSPRPAVAPGRRRPSRPDFAAVLANALAAQAA